MVFKSNLSSLLLKELSNLDPEHIAEYEHKDLFKLSYDKGIIDDDLVEDSLEKSILAKATVILTQLKNKNFYTVYADHISSPRSIAYALKHNYFNSKDISQIEFTDGDNLESYIKKYATKNFVQELKKDLLD